MPPELDRLLAELQQRPVDRSLDGVADGVRSRLRETAAARSQTWGLRAAAVIAVMAGGAVAGTATAAAGDTKATSPFAAWSSLAPSTLLDVSE